MYIKIKKFSQNEEKNFQNNLHFNNSFNFSISFIAI